MDNMTLMFDYSPPPEIPSSAEASSGAATLWTDSSGLGHDGDDTPRFENMTDSREVLEARQLPGFHDIDPRHKEKVITSIIINLSAAVI